MSYLNKHDLNFESVLYDSESDDISPVRVEAIGYLAGTNENPWDAYDIVEDLRIYDLSGDDSKPKDITRALNDEELSRFEEEAYEVLFRLKYD